MWVLDCANNIVVTKILGNEEFYWFKGVPISKEFQESVSINPSLPDKKKRFYIMSGM